MRPREKATALYRRWRNSPCPYWKGNRRKRPSIPRLRNIFTSLSHFAEKKDVPLVFVVTPYETSGPSTACSAARRASARKTVCPCWITTRPVGGISALTINGPGRPCPCEHRRRAKISTDLAAYLAEHYGMPDKRGDAALRGVGRGGKDGAPGRTEYNVALHAGHGRIFPPAHAG